MGILRLQSNWRQKKQYNMHNLLVVVQRQVIVMVNEKIVTQNTPNSVIKNMPVSELPKEILDYYVDNDYGKRGIPLSVKAVKEIAKILDKENNHDQNKNH